ncbi:MAG: hypothetical protein GY719_15745 [bacterium]|nr:hypothetical protein [bacterium]
MALHEVAYKALQRFYAGKPIEKRSQVEKAAREAPSTNIGTMAAAALQDWDRLDELLGGDNEFGSWRYEPWSAAAAGVGKGPAAHRWFAAWIARAALTVRNVRQVTLTLPSGTTEARKRNFGMAGYRGPISCFGGNRFLWKSEPPLLERSLAAPGWAWATKHPKKAWDGWNHPGLGWPMEGIRRGLKRFDTDFKQALKARDPVRLAPALQAQPLRPKQRIEILSYKNGDMATVMKNSTFATRGPVNITLYDEGTKTLRLISASGNRPSGGGEWYATRAAIEGNKAATWRARKKSVRVEVRLPKSELDWHLVWDNMSARIVGAVPDPGPGPTPPRPEPAPPAVNVEPHFQAIEGRIVRARDGSGEGGTRALRDIHAYIAEVLRGS